MAKKTKKEMVVETPVVETPPVVEKPQVEEVNIKENFGDPGIATEEEKIDEGHILNEYEGKDGKMYQEVEFADGSIQVREIKKEPVKSTTTTKTKSKK